MRRCSCAAVILLGLAHCEARSDEFRIDFSTLEPYYVSNARKVDTHFETIDKYKSSEVAFQIDFPKISRGAVSLWSNSNHVPSGDWITYLTLEASRDGMTWNNVDHGFTASPFGNRVKSLDVLVSGFDRVFIRTIFQGQSVRAFQPGAYISAALVPEPMNVTPLFLAGVGLLPFFRKRGRAFAN